MKKLFLVGILVPGILSAQRWHVNLFGGISNYSGDLQDKQFTLDESYAISPFALTLVLPKWVHRTPSTSRICNPAT
jgi:hypothetical protein